MGKRPTKIPSMWMEYEASSREIFSEDEVIWKIKSKNRAKLVLVE